MLTMHLPIHLAQGNMGALNFIAQVNTYALKHKEKGAIICKKIADCNIAGAGLWVLFSEFCDDDMLTTSRLCENCPDDILIDACSRQDRTGRALVKDYVHPCTESQLIDIDPNWKVEIERYKSVFGKDKKGEPLDELSIKDLLNYERRWAYICGSLQEGDIIGYYEMHDDVDSTDLSDMSKKEAEYYMSKEYDTKDFDFVFF